jgi:hypothetical protein
MKRLLLAWFFAVWGVSGAYFYSMGPFGTESDCTEIRDSVKKDTIGLNTVSKCWSDGQ